MGPLTKWDGKSVRDSSCLDSEARFRSEKNSNLLIMCKHDNFDDALVYYNHRTTEVLRAFWNILRLGLLHRQQGRWNITSLAKKTTKKQPCVQISTHVKYYPPSNTTASLTATVALWHSTPTNRKANQNATFHISTIEKTSGLPRVTFLNRTLQKSSNCRHTTHKLRVLISDGSYETLRDLVLRQAKKTNTRPPLPPLPLWKKMWGLPSSGSFICMLLHRYNLIWNTHPPMSLPVVVADAEKPYTQRLCEKSYQKLCHQAFQARSQDLIFFFREVLRRSVHWCSMLYSSICCIFELIT